MTSKTFSTDKWKELGTLFAEQFRRGLPVGIVYWALFVLGTFLYRGSSGLILAIQSVCVGVYSLAMPPWLLGECFGRPQSDYIGAMPVGRGTRFLGSLLTALTFLWTPIILGLGLRGIIMAPYPNEAQEAWAAMALYLILGTATLCFCFLTAAASGTYFEYVLNTGLLALLWPVLAMLWRALASSVIPWGFSRSDINLLLEAGSPPLALLLMPREQSGIGPTLLWLGGFGILLGIGAWWLYCRRKGEDAGASRWCRPVELVIRVGLSLCAAVFVGYHASEMAFYGSWGDWGIPASLGSMVLALAAAWVVTEAFYRRSLKQLPRHWVPLALSAGLTALGVGIVSTGLGQEAPRIDWTEVLWARVYNGQDFATVYADGYPVVDLNAGNDEKSHGSLCPGVASLDMLDRVEELWNKWMEMERASQFPYLPGRNGYHSGGLQLGHVWLNADISRDLTWHSRPTEKSQALFEECQRLAQEIACSEEYISSTFPVNALGALAQIEQLEMEESEEKKTWGDYYWVFDSTDEPPRNAKSLAALPKDFPEDLEAALREDLGAGRCTTYNWLSSNAGNCYRLRYNDDNEFIAKGGIFSLDQDFDGKEAEPAAGKHLRMFRNEYYGSDQVFCVTPEMSSTFALLEKVYGEK